MPASITITELHATTGELVRRAGASRTPVMITDRGEPVAVLANPSLLQQRRRSRALLPEYEEMMRRPPGSDLIEDVDAMRGAR